jgi:hypothetical protein
MFLFNLQAVLVGIAVFSIPALILELNLLVIGISFVTPSLMIATLVLGIVSGIASVIIEEFI